ncbi:RDD family protein [Clostridium sp. DSM 8431]|uniref:RDD family protein n=1 Tax=Clostridium sp. DSM 8431 TaxID=1761781 RepID=UPI0008E9ED55|nr:RDD family protein [Clostridium sp. DSM 8431]SFU66382.1 RDD family protein [Clostridium sp. DSM 8431]
MLKRLFANVLDEIIIFAISVLLLLAAEGIMKVIGFKIVDAAAFLLIIYAVINVLYFPLLEGGKYATTLGKRLLKLDD